MTFTFNETSQREYTKWQKKFPDDTDGKRSLVIPALWISQKQNGWINRDVVDYVAEITQTEPLHVWGVATFYTMFQKEKVGKHLLQFCTNISCGLNGGEELMEHTCKKLGVRPGETTKDGNFTVFEVECLGACGNAPVMQLDDKYCLDLKEEDINKLIEELKQHA